MLKAEKRYTKRCRFKEYGRAQTKCRCSYQAIGMLNGIFVRDSLRTSNYEEALKKIRERELGGKPAPAPVTIEEAAEAFLNDIRAQQMNHSTTHLCMEGSVKTISPPKTKGIRYVTDGGSRVIGPERMRPSPAIRPGVPGVFEVSSFHDPFAC